MQIRLYYSKLLETTVHQFCEKWLHITFKTSITANADGPRNAA